MAKTKRKRQYPTPEAYKELLEALGNEIDQQASVVNPVEQKVEVAPSVKEDYTLHISTDDAAQITGCSNGEIADMTSVTRWLLDGALNVMAYAAKDRDLSKLLPVLKSLLLNSRPRTPVEAMLLTQMITTQEMASRLGIRALYADDAQTSASYSARAERFMNLFVRQAECLQKLKGLSGQQKVVVEHLNVSGGGKAVVGQVIGKREDGPEGKS